MADKAEAERRELTLEDRAIAYAELVKECMSSEHFGQLAWQFERLSGSSGLKVQAAIAC